MGCNDGKGGAAIAVSDATAAMSDDTRAAPVNLLRPPLHQLRRNSDQRWAHQTKRTREAWLSSSVSAFEKQKLRYLLQEPSDPQGLGSARVH